MMLLLTTSAPLRAFVLGGGAADKDCRVAFGGVDLTDGLSGVVCTDGDPACDRDGAADGTCRFAVNLCAGVDVPGCTPGSVSTLDVTGLPLAPPPLPSTPGACGTVSDVVVPDGAAVAATAVARTFGALKDVDYLNLCCRAAPAPFDAARCALAIDPRVAGCVHGVPHAIVAKFTHARRLVDEAATNPAHARRDVRKAEHALNAVRGLARRLAKKDVCGDTLGLIASHALATLQ